MTAIPVGKIPGRLLQSPRPPRTGRRCLLGYWPSPFCPRRDSLPGYRHGDHPALSASSSVAQGSRQQSGHPVRLRGRASPCPGADPTPPGHSWPAGTFYAGEHTSHFADTSICRHCQQLDSVEHRLLHCPATEMARRGMPPDWITWPKHLTHYLLPTAPEALDSLLAARLTADHTATWHASPPRGAPH